MKRKNDASGNNMLFYKLMLSIGLVAQITFSFAQTNPFQKVYGGASYDEGNALRQTDDDGFIVTGKTYSFGAGDYDGYAVKTDKEGNILWSKSYGTTGADAFSDVVIMPDKGYLMAGSSSKIDFWMGTVNMFYMVRTDASGNTQWAKQVSTGSSRIHNIIPTSDGSFGLYGDDAYNIYLAKIDANGQTIFYNTYYLFTGEGVSQAGAGKKTADGGFILCGQVRNQSTGLFNLFLLKVTATGEIQWTKTYTAPNGSTYATDVTVLNDGSFVVTGSAEGLATELSDVLLLKTDADGVLQWVHSYSGENDEKAKSITVACDGGFILTGNSKSFKNNIPDLYLVKTNADGIIQWSNVHGGFNADEGTAVIITNDCGIAVTGSTQSYGIGLSDVFLLKLTAEGEDLKNCNRTAVTSIQYDNTLSEAWRSIYGQMGFAATSDLSTSILNAVTVITPDVCNECRKPLADFDYVQNKMSLNFLNYSERATSYTWSLDNNVSDTMYSPVYEYAATGLYNVKLVVENTCGKDSITKLVNVVNTTDCLFNLQPGPVRGQDASINNAPDKMRSNFSDYPALVQNNWTHGSQWDSWRSLLRFDLSSVCDISHLLDSRLSLFYPVGYINYLHNYGNGFYISRINSPWKDYLVNWKTQPTTSPIDMLSIGETPWGSELLNQDVYQLTKNMIAEGNYGFLFQMKDETNRYYSAADYASSNFALPEKRPLLQLRYIPLNSSVTFTDTTICAGDSIQLVASGGVKYKWYPSTGLSCDNCPAPKASPEENTEYRVFIYNCENCAEVKKISIDVVRPFIADTLLKICKGDSVQLHALSSFNYHWTPDQWINDNTLQDPKVSPPFTTTYYVSGVSGPKICQPSDSIKVVVHAPIPTKPVDTLLCGKQLVLGKAYEDASYVWQDGSLLPYYIASDTGTYEVSITNTCGVYHLVYRVKKCCEEINIPNLITPNDDGLNDYFVIGCLGDGNWHLQVYNRWGSIVYENNDYANNWKADGLSDGIYYHNINKKDITYTGWVQVLR